MSLQLQTLCLNGVSPAIYCQISCLFLRMMQFGYCSYLTETNKMYEILIIGYRNYTI